MQSVLVIVHLFLSIGLVGLILIQHGKGADMGAAFGSGASATVFGSRGAGNFLSRTTAVLATLFFVTSLALAYFAMQSTEPATLMEGVKTEAAAPAEAEVPAAPAATDLPAIPEAPAASGSEVPQVEK
ncbi:MAG: preprotein translocase subunit SecG [Chromatiaceae bacterium]|nr:preprotein translocase subunit SecG [Gammaproteobacteria bacterium]MCP5304627.1 preprotein translocase subunit SecG [Chromatiaceae bacterium]MCP5314354.1 preprotein translocase subunit SecG [Chromatiaceae bacterium]